MVYTNLHVVELLERLTTERHFYFRVCTILLTVARTVGCLVFGEAPFVNDVGFQQRSELLSRQAVGNTIHVSIFQSGFTEDETLVANCCGFENLLKLCDAIHLKNEIEMASEIINNNNTESVCDKNKK